MTALALLWIATIIGVWVLAIRAWQDAPAKTYPENTPTILGILLATLPPTLVLLATIGVGFSAAPTVQFNVGSDEAMAAWSQWVHLWPAILLFAAMQFLVYLFWLVGAMLNSIRFPFKLMLLAAWLQTLLSIAVLFDRAPRA